MHRLVLILCFALCLYSARAFDVNNMFSQPPMEDESFDRSKEYQRKVNEDAMKFVKIPGKNNRVVAEEDTTVAYKTVLISYRQLVQNWLKKFPSVNAKSYRFLVDVSAKQLERLRQFASSKDMDPKTALKEFHASTDLLQRMVQSVEEEMPTNDGLTWSAWVRSFNLTSVAQTTAVALLAAAITYIAIRSHLRKGRWVTALLIFAFIVSFLMNWYNLYLEAQAEFDEHLMKQVPKHCLGHPQTFWETVKGKFTGYVAIPTNECQKHFRVARGNAHVRATPMKALSRTLTDLFASSLGEIGEGLSKFFAGTMMHVPGIMWPIVMTIIVVVFVLIVLICTKDEFSAGYGLFAVRRARPAAIANSAPILQQLEGESNAAGQIEALQSEIKALKQQLTETLALPAPQVKPKEEEEKEEVKPQVKNEPVAEETPESTVVQRQPPAPGFRAEFVKE